MASEGAMELITQARATIPPPNMTTAWGPYRSTNQASIGTSQVSVKTKIEKATWIAARPQWNFASIGLTNNVQPYCRLAIMAMQSTPTSNCIQRLASSPLADTSFMSDISYPLFFIW